MNKKSLAKISSAGILGVSLAVGGWSYYTSESNVVGTGGTLDEFCAEYSSELPNYFYVNLSNSCKDLNESSPVNGLHKRVYNIETPQKYNTVYCSNLASCSWVSESKENRGTYESYTYDVSEVIEKLGIKLSEGKCIRGSEELLSSFPSWLYSTKEDFLDKYSSINDRNCRSDRVS